MCSWLADHPSNRLGGKLVISAEYPAPAQSEARNYEESSQVVEARVNKRHWWQAARVTDGRSASARRLYLRIFVATRQVPARAAAATPWYSVVSRAVRNLDVNLDSLNLLCATAITVSHARIPLFW